MSKKDEIITGRTFCDRIKDAVRAFLGKPKHTLQLGLRGVRCDECERPKIKEERREVETVIASYYKTPHSLWEEARIETEISEILGRALLQQGLVSIKKINWNHDTPEGYVTRYIAEVQAVRPTKEEEGEA